MTVRVLLVDDEPMFLEALRALLDRDDRVEIVGAAADAEQALDLARALRPDVAVVDLRLRGTSGFDLTRSLLADEPALRVLAVSGLSHESDVHMALEAGATAFLLKGGLHHEVGDAIVAAAGPRPH